MLGTDDAGDAEGTLGALSSFIVFKNPLGVFDSFTGSVFDARAFFLLRCMLARGPRTELLGVDVVLLSLDESELPLFLELGFLVDGGGLAGVFFDLIVTFPGERSHDVRHEVRRVRGARALRSPKAMPKEPVRALFSELAWMFPTARLDPNAIGRILGDPMSRQNLRRAERETFVDVVGVERHP